MARIRTIKPDFWQDEDLAGVSEPALILAAGLLNHADDEGYFKANPGLIKAAVFPLREPSVSIHEILKELSNIGYLKLYNGIDGKKYGCIASFTKHQRINRPSNSKIKELIDFNDDSVSPHESLTPGKEQGREGNREQGREECAEPEPGSTPAAQQNETDHDNDDPPPVILLPLNDKTEHPITQSHVDEFAELYPSVDVMQQLRKMRGWLLNNPAKRKTRKGIMRFVNNWLSGEQDKGAPNHGTAHQRAHNPKPSLAERATQAREDYERSEQSDNGEFVGAAHTLVRP